MGKKNKGMTIDWETADRITVINLKDCRDLLVQEIEKHESDPTRNGIDSIDYMDNVSYLRAVEKVLQYFGEK